MMLMTVLSILVVDFPVFPVIHVKCETIGVALVWSLDCDIRFITLLLKNLDGPWCRIFCVLARSCIYLLYNLSKTLPIYVPQSCPILFFNHSCASSYHPGFTSSRSFAFSHTSRWSRWFEYERILTHPRRCLNDIPLRSRISSRSWRLSTICTSIFSN